MKSIIYEEALEVIDGDVNECGGIDFKDDYNTIKHALKQAQKQEQEHIEYSKKVQEQFANDTKRIGELKSKLIKQEQLLELYRKLDDCIVAPTGHHVCRYTDDEKYARIRKQIKELEK